MKTKKKKIIFYNNYKKDLQNKISSLTNNDLDLLKQDIVKTSKKKGGCILTWKWRKYFNS